jgi:hypothetical protein
MSSAPSRAVELVEYPSGGAETDIAAEAFHVDAIALHEHRLLELLRREPNAISGPMLIGVCDLLAWAVRLREDVRAQLPPRVTADIEPLRNDRGHIAVGAKWARDQIVHGRGLGIVALRSLTVDDSSDSTDILWNDPEVDFNGVPQQATIRLVDVEADIGDANLRRFFNACVAGRRVIVVAQLLAGQRTLGAL